MSKHNKDGMTSNEMLVAFLDGELPPEEQRIIANLVERDEALGQRLAFLASGRAPIRNAFDALLDEAPTSRMAENFQRAAVQSDPARAFSRRHMIAAAVTLVAVGIGGGLGIDRIIGSHGREDEGWRAVVANYMALYSTTTLANLSVDPTMLDAQVASVSHVLGMPLKREDITLPRLEFKRVQLLQFRDRPLAQFAYLDERSQPLAVCVFANSNGAAPPQFEERQGMSIVFWSTPSRSFLVIGHSSRETLGKLAGQLRQSLSV